MDAEYLYSTMEETPNGAPKKHGKRRIHPFSLTAATRRPAIQSNFCVTFLVFISYLIFSLMITAGGVLIVFIATVFFFEPQPAPPYIVVSSSSADVHNISGNLTRSNVFVSFMVEGSHNKGIIYYKNINVSIFKDQNRISSTTVEPSEQHRHNRTTHIVAVFQDMSMKAEVWIFAGAAEGQCAVAYLDCKLTVKEDNQKVECNEIKVYFAPLGL